MLQLKKILIHEERPDSPEFLFKIIVNRGYKAGFAKDANEILSMLSSDKYDVVLANGGIKTLNAEHHIQLQSSSVFIIGIKDACNRTQDNSLEADLYLLRPFLISELWRALKEPVKH